MAVRREAHQDRKAVRQCSRRLHWPHPQGVFKPQRPLRPHVANLIIVLRITNHQLSHLQKHTHRLLQHQTQQSLRKGETEIQTKIGTAFTGQ